MAGQREIGELVERLDRDGAFATALETDAFAALESGGFEDLSRAVEQERDRMAELVDRIYEDAGFRQEIEADPTGTLGEWGLPEDAVEPLLVLVGAPDDVIDRATADVEAHLGKKPATVAAMTAILGALAFGQQASAATHPGSKAQVAKPAAKAQVARPGARAEISPVFRAQIRAEIKSQALVGVRSAWHSAAKPDAKWQSRMLSILRAQGTLAR
jgi:hypothetical protein